MKEKIFFLTLLQPVLLTGCTEKPDQAQANAWEREGDLKLQTKDYEGAIVDFSKAVTFNPMDTTAYNNRGIAQDNLGHYGGGDSRF